jgi:hypothetical protein
MAPTLQDRMRAKLCQLGIPANSIECYGSQIMITAACGDSADRWYTTLRKFCSTVRTPKKSRVVNTARTAQEIVRNERGYRGAHNVWLVWGTV